MTLVNNSLSPKLNISSPKVSREFSRKEKSLIFLPDFSFKKSKSFLSSSVKELLLVVVLLVIIVLASKKFDNDAPS